MVADENTAATRSQSHPISGCVWWLVSYGGHVDDPQASSSLVINSRLANQAHLPYWGVIRRNERIPIDDPTTKTVHKGKNSRPPRRRSLPIIYQKAPPDSTSSAESSHPPATQVCGSEIPEAKLQPNVGAGKAPRPRRCDTIVARYGNEAAGRIRRNQPYATDLARSGALTWDSTMLLHRLVRSPTRASPYPVVSLQGFQIRHTRHDASPPGPLVRERGQVTSGTCRRSGCGRSSPCRCRS